MSKSNEWRGRGRPGPLPRWAGPILVAANLALFPAHSLAATWKQVLEGRWIGPNLTLTIDQGAVMANRDPAKPFDWQAFHIVTATGAMVVFDIGADRYIGILNGDTLTVTQAGRTGSSVLARDRTKPQDRPLAPPIR